jgi:hypothetical protein
MHLCLCRRSRLNGLGEARLEWRLGKGIMADRSETIAIIGCCLIGESWSAVYTETFTRDNAIMRVIAGRGEVGDARG